MLRPGTAVLMVANVMVDDKLADLKSTTVQEYIVSSSRPMQDCLGFNVINSTVAFLDAMLGVLGLSAPD
jgi:hypothetical protein